MRPCVSLPPPPGARCRADHLLRRRDGFRPVAGRRQRHARRRGRQRYPERRGGSGTASCEHNAGRVEAFLGNSGFGGADDIPADGVTLLSSDFLQSIENLTGSAFDDSFRATTVPTPSSGSAATTTSSAFRGTTPSTAATATTRSWRHGLDRQRHLARRHRQRLPRTAAPGDDIIDGGAGYDRAAVLHRGTSRSACRSQPAGRRPGHRPGDGHADQHRECLWHGVWRHADRRRQRQLAVGFAVADGTISAVRTTTRSSAAAATIC